MAKDIKRFDCLLISPGDVIEERETLEKLINTWNAQIGELFNTAINLVKYETHSVPDMKKAPQKVLNEQIVDKCDMAIAIFWGRLGTPTDDYESGSIEEIERLIKAGKRVIIYFCNRAIPQENLEIKQYKKLQIIKENYLKKGLVDSYFEISELREKVLLHTSNIIINSLIKDKGMPIEVEHINKKTEKPEIKIFARASLANHPFRGMLYAINLTAQNHSTQKVYINSFIVKLKNHMQIIFPSDYITEKYQERRVLNPGESYSFNINPQDLIRENDIDDIDTAILIDDIDREYKMDSEQFHKVIRSSLDMHNDNDIVE